MNFNDDELKRQIEHMQAMFILWQQYEAARGKNEGCPIWRNPVPPIRTDKGDVEDFIRSLANGIRL